MSFAPHPSAAPAPEPAHEEAAGPESSSARQPPRGWAPQCAVFDCDGVLMDTESGWVRAVAQASHELGVADPHDLADRLTALPAETIARRLAEEVIEARGEQNGAETPTEGPGDEGADDEEPGNEGIEALTARILDRLVEMDEERLREGVDLLPGVEEVLAELSAVMPVAVASNSSGPILAAKLEAGGLTRYLRTWVSVDDVAHGKPAPDMYLEAVARLGFSPEQALTVEDSEPGARAAVAAGTRVVVLSEAPEPPAGTWVLSDFRDPEFRRRLREWTARTEETASASASASEATS